MKKFVVVCIVWSVLSQLCYATSWDEPWMEQVVENADAFVKVDIVKNESSFAEVRLLKQLAGNPVPEEFKIVGFSLISYSSYSVDEETFPFRIEEEYYLMVKESQKKGEYLIATPTTGWALSASDGVYATYRHSYHQAIVPEELYEWSMAAIFDFLHGKVTGRQRVVEFILEQLEREPALLKNSQENDASLESFFNQHVALELFRYFGDPQDIAIVDPFLSADDYHIQISAVRAIAGHDSDAVRERLINFIEADRHGFAKVMAVWGLDRLNAKECTDRLKAFMENGTNEDTGFGGNIMDPRIGTHFPPTVKSAIALLISKWSLGEEEVTSVTRKDESELVVPDFVKLLLPVVGVLIIAVGIGALLLLRKRKG